MDAQNREKFAEPRGWAMKWVFTQETIPSTAEQEAGNGNETWEKFVEPRGWAMKWDGSALPGAEEEQNVPTSTGTKG